MFKSISRPVLTKFALRASKTQRHGDAMMMIALAASISIYATVQLRLALLRKDLAFPMIFSSGCLAWKR